MRIVTAPTRQTLATRGLNPEAGLGESVSDDSRRSAMLAWHLNRWLLARRGGTGDRPWLANLAGFSGYLLAEFRERLKRVGRALEGTGAYEADVFGWEFMLSANVWKSSRNVSGIYVMHTGFEEECRRLASETGLSARLADPLLRSWLLSLFRCSTAECPVILLSLHEDESELSGSDALFACESLAETLAESEMNAADPLPRGVWRLLKGGWNVAATDEDFEVAQALQQLGQASADQGESLAFAVGEDRSQRHTQLSAQMFRDVRTLELRGLAKVKKERTRVKKERAKNLADFGSTRHSGHGKFRGGLPSIQVGRSVRNFLKRRFLRKPPP